MNAPPASPALKEAIRVLNYHFETCVYCRAETEHYATCPGCSRGECLASFTCHEAERLLECLRQAAAEARS